MSGSTFVIADPHFGHVGVTKFKRADGSPLRPWDDVEEMNTALIENWNRVVKREDRIYVMGDVAMSRRAAEAVLPHLRGRKVLVKGNHDVDKLSYYSRYFDDVRAYVPKKGFILSHIPIHPGSLSRWKLNIHGHTHANVVTMPRPYDEPYNYEGEYDVVPDPRYVCVSVEQIDYTPKLLSTVLKENGHDPQ